MKRVRILLYIVLILALGGCNLPGGSAAALPEVDRSAKLNTSTAAQFSAQVTATRQPTQTPSAESNPEGSNQPAAESAPAMHPFLVQSEVTIQEIHMLDALNGWGVGTQTDSSDHILFTEDGGQTWAERTPPEPAIVETLRATTHFADARLAWVLYAPENDPPPMHDPIIWYTRDGGHSWQASQPLPLTGQEGWFDPEDFVFIDERSGWLLVHIDAGMSHDYSHLFATHDGGQTWERIADPYGAGLQSLQNTGMAFADDQFGWVSKDNLGVMQGAFYEATFDGGLTWETQFLPAPDGLDWFTEISQCATSSPLFLQPEEIGLLIVRCYTLSQNDTTFGEASLTYIYATPDRGENWHYSQLASPVESLVFVTPELGWAFGRDYFTTTDGGLTWKALKSLNWDGQFSFVDAELGWAVARNEDRIALVSTSNGALTWQIIEPVMK